jgi:hypothetical protein
MPDATMSKSYPIDYSTAAPECCSILKTVASDHPDPKRVVVWANELTYRRMAETPEVLDYWRRAGSVTPLLVNCNFPARMYGITWALDDTVSDDTLELRRKA